MQPLNSETTLNTFLPQASDAPTEKIQEVASRSLLLNVVIGIAKSRLFRAVVFTGAMVGLLFVLPHLLPLILPGLALPTIAPWMIAAVASGSFVLAIIFQLPFKGKQKMEFELSALSRLMKSQNFNQIPLEKGVHKLFLGALPNKLSRDGEKLALEGVKTVVSVNEEWEHDPVGLSIPYSTADWNKLGIKHIKIAAKDHTLLTDAQLNQGNEEIAKALQNGNVYVHCRAGVGRSGMLVAAYMIRTENTPVDQACDTIKKHRTAATIGRKTARLQQWKESF